jgi:hypothetical protein
VIWLLACTGEGKQAESSAPALACPLAEGCFDAVVEARLKANQVGTMEVSGGSATVNLIKDESNCSVVYSVSSGPAACDGCEFAFTLALTPTEVWIEVGECPTGEVQGLSFLYADYREPTGIWLGVPIPGLGVPDPWEGSFKMTAGEDMFGVTVGEVYWLMEGAVYSWK